MKPCYVLLPALLAGCSSASSSSRTAPAPAAAASRDVITQSEIQNANVATAYDVVARLRGHWLRRRGAVSIQEPNAGEVVVFVNEVRTGGAEVLRGIRTDETREIRYLNGPDATIRYGTGFGGGVIQVFTK
ncbi:MAG: TonB-dependent receptor plug domain-containing protein [Gemmatimonadales bacterium]